MNCFRAPSLAFVRFGVVLAGFGEEDAEDEFDAANARVDHEDDTVCIDLCPAVKALELLYNPAANQIAY